MSENMWNVDRCCQSPRKCPYMCKTWHSDRLDNVGFTCERAAKPATTVCDCFSTFEEWNHWIFLTKDKAFTTFVHAMQLDSFKEFSVHCPATEHWCFFMGGLGFLQWCLSLQKTGILWSFPNPNQIAFVIRPNQIISTALSQHIMKDFT